MEQFYVFANSEDSLSIFNDNAGGRFRIYFPNPYVLVGTWECALLEISFVHKLITPTRRIYVCCNFVNNSYVKDSYIPILQSLSVLNKDITDDTFESHVLSRPTPRQSREPSPEFRRQHGLLRSRRDTLGCISFPKRMTLLSMID